MKRFRYLLTAAAKTGLIGNPRFIWNMALQQLGLRRFLLED